VVSRSSKVLGAARSISTPAFDGNSPAFIQAGAIFNPAPSKNRVTLLGVEAQKIQLLVNGQRRQLDPLGNGSYIWPSLSPDKKSLLAYDMDRGAFVSDLSGKVLAKLGGLDGPTWSRDGDWVVAFDEVNDGHAVTGSDLFAVKPDGTGKTQLTTTADVIELYPSCSPTENKIVCHTLDGKLLLLTYEVRP
jgi:Tol biopolymer transport system component